MTKTLETTETVTLTLRLATTKDFRKEMSVVEEGRVVVKTLPKIGQPYWVKSQLTQKFDAFNYQISDNTQWDEFKDYLRRNMVYVPITFTDYYNSKS